MDAKKVLAVLREIEWSLPANEAQYHTYSIGGVCPSCELPYHKTDCRLAALIDAAEHEAQAGGWKPGSEPPDTDRLIEFVFRNGDLRIRAIGWYSDEEGWHTHTDVIIWDFFVLWWRDLPPLPEQAAAGKGEGS